MGNKQLTLTSAIDKQSLLWVALFFILSSFLLALFFIEIDAFESFYEYSRHHEDWELDEVFLAIFSVIISFAIASILMVNLVTKRLYSLMLQQVETEKKILMNRKTQSMGSMVGGVAHSMNNHLQPILTLSRLVKSDLPENSPLHEDLDRIYSSANSASQILRKILNFSHLEGTTDEPRDVNDPLCNIETAVQEGIALGETIVPSSITIDLDIDTAEDLVRATKVDIEIMILNFISNAVDALSGQIGKISITLGHCEQKRIEKLNLDESQRWICLEINDTGSGMTEEQKIRMFDPFFTTKEVGKGTGLGLSENFGIISHAGGAMDVETKINVGTSISVYLPLIKTKEVK